LNNIDASDQKLKGVALPVAYFNNKLCVKIFAPDAGKG
jgi:hypothetical protein